jgi:hypothetical protein
MLSYNFLYVYIIRIVNFSHSINLDDVLSILIFKQQDLVILLIVLFRIITYIKNDKKIMVIK